MPKSFRVYGLGVQTLNPQPYNLPSGRFLISGDRGGAVRAHCWTRLEVALGGIMGTWVSKVISRGNMG